MNKSKKIVAMLALVGLSFSFSPVLASETEPAYLNSPSMDTGIIGTVLVAPSASPEAGTYTAAQTVTLTAQGALSIHYTTDGSDPACSSDLTYSNPIAVDNSLVIKAISCGDGIYTSVKSFSYTINIQQQQQSSGGGGGGGGGSVSTCTSFTYTSWSACQTDNTQTRTIVTSSPSGCMGGSPVLTQTCVYVASGSSSTTEEKIEEEKPIVLGVESPDYSGYTNLYGVAGDIVEIVTADEAEGVLDCTSSIDATSEGIYNKIIKVYSFKLTNEEKQAIKCFIQNGTQTTKRLGAGERGGVVNSFITAFGKVPASIEDWKDIAKIANGRWPKQKNEDYENKMKTGPFVKVYQRKSDLAKSADASAISIMSYGLLPVNRNMQSEKAAIYTFKSIYKYYPSSALDWNIIRAIAYSGAKR